jgi:hypothetical protein
MSLSTTSILMKVLGIPASSQTQMELQTVDTAHVLRVDISQFHQLINSQIFAMRWLWNLVALAC